MASLVTCSTALASGKRDVVLTLQSIESLPEKPLSDLTKKVSYLGSTAHWHIFGETITVLSRGYPYDNTFVYKVNAGQFTIENGWSLELDEMDYRLYVTSCPVVHFNRVEPGFQRVILTDRGRQCLQVPEQPVNNR